MSRATEITAYPDGPLLVRGPVRLVDADGAEIPVRRATIALCRCGRSRLKPFCDGTHRTLPFDAGPTPHRNRPARAAGR